jgi:hypothetical protein
MVAGRSWASETEETVAPPPSLLLSEEDIDSEQDDAAQEQEVERQLPKQPVTEVRAPESDDDSALDKVSESPLNFALQLSGLWTTYSKYVADAASNTVDNSNLAGGFLMEFEWMPITSYGKLGLGTGIGFTTVSGIAFADGSGNTANLITLPVELYLSYRLDFVKNQWIVPYGRIGGEFQLASPTSSTISGGSFLTYEGFQWAAGGEFCLNILEPTTARGLDIWYGINNTYLYFEYVNAMALQAGKQPDLSRTEFRIGLRVEF